MTTPVSIVLPTLDEREHITDCLDSLLAQDYPAIAEILVVDGGSNDGTRDLAARHGDPVRVVPNPKVTAAAAMNVGIAAARSDVIVRADAHTLYAPDFVSRCVEVLEHSGADVVGGPMRPVGTTAYGRAVAAVTSSPAGIGPGRFHYADEAQDVDTVYLGTYRKDVVTEVGGYDEDTLQWAAEDQELNYRLRRRGRRIRLDPSIRSEYFPRQTVRALWRQYYNYGLCKASTLNKHRRLPSWRPLAPAAMVAGAAGLGVAGAAARRPLLVAAPVLAYVAGAGVVALRLADRPGVAPHRALGALSVCHWAYGLGFWAGVGRMLTGRPFDTRPRKGR
ncbi:MAG: glycosyltransferase family 2 protein [Acidimicrobiales bacterium]|nr:glycosyltransferase family 2 protein [Acidimicrobiales bacterium]MCB9372574.1 glycosyltransferase family 2 protein [Microthrixaceae bacterium]